MKINFHNSFLANELCSSNVFHNESQNSVIEWLMWEGACVDCPVRAPVQAGPPIPDCPGFCTIRGQISSMIESP